MLLAHLLEWQIQPSRRGRSPALTIAEQRDAIDTLLDDAPSLRVRPGEDAFPEKIWRRAVLPARRETDLDHFPDRCPWPLHEVIRDNWLPDRTAIRAVASRVSIA